MDSDKQFSCKVCKKLFDKKKNLTRHKRIHNTGEKLFTCDICEKSFTDNCNLVCHKRSHTGDKPYACDICERAFSQKINLTNHKRIHTGEKPFKCDICERAFSQSSALVRHRIIHTGEKSIKCDVCEKLFLHHSDLIRHSRIHTGEKPYACEICQKSFANSSGLSAHKQTSIHLNRQNILNNLDFSNYQNQFTDYEEAFNVGDIKKEMNDGEVAEHPNDDAGGGDLLITADDIKCEIEEDESVDQSFHNQQKSDEIRLYSCDICGERFTERIVLLMHKDINHSQNIPEIV